MWETNQLLKNRHLAQSYILNTVLVRFHTSSVDSAWVGTKNASLCYFVVCFHTALFSNAPTPLEQHIYLLACGGAVLYQETLNTGTFALNTSKHWVTSHFSNFKIVFFFLANVPDKFVAAMGSAWADNKTEILLHTCFGCPLPKICMRYSLLPAFGVSLSLHDIYLCNQIRVHFNNPETWVSI